MKKKVILFIVILTMLFDGITINASDIISGGISELSLAAERYYNTKIAYSDMIISLTRDNMYEVYYYHANGKNLAASLYLTEWGTWNLGEWKITANGQTKPIIGGGTDWEYVFRVINPVSYNLEFTGGNHGSEKLNSISMFDSVTGEVFELGVGESKYVNRLVIVENTSILLANLDYLPYANVERTYTFVGNRINLDCKIEFVRDVKMALSYSAMASVDKDFGRYCMFDDGTYVSTSGKGTSSNHYLGHRDSMTATLTGDDVTASLTVGIYNKKDMTDNFSNMDKTFIWDMSPEFNKVYFSRGNLTELETITTGTVWDFGSYWKINL